MSTPSISKKVLTSAIVALPFPFILLIALDAVSALPGAQGATELLGSDIGTSFYIVTWILFLLASVVGLLFVNPTSSVAAEIEDEDDLDDSAEGSETGTVKWFNVNKGFGFITTSSGEDVFVHFRSIRGRGRRSLRQGQSVSFDVTDGEKGKQAENVSVIR